jgi:uncharacterized protein (UPF0548 family)
MPFRLKNVEATYQSAMVTLFHYMMHKEKEIKVYVDDMIVKSKKWEWKIMSYWILFFLIKMNC